MRLSKRRRGPTVRGSLTPMIDIVFLLIIFFMTLPQLTRVVYHPLELPTVQTAAPDEMSSQLTINVDEQGQMIVASKPLAWEELDALIARQLAEVEQRPERLQVLIRADGRGRSAAVNRLLEQLQRWQIDQVRISVRSRDMQN